MDDMIGGDGFFVFGVEDRAAGNEFKIPPGRVSILVGQEVNRLVIVITSHRILAHSATIVLVDDITEHPVEVLQVPETGVFAVNPLPGPLHIQAQAPLVLAKLRQAGFTSLAEAAQFGKMFGEHFDLPAAADGFMKKAPQEWQSFTSPFS